MSHCPRGPYDASSYYEMRLGLPEPGFNYEFIDAGLGAAEPVYPMFKKGTQSLTSRRPDPG